MNFKEALAHDARSVFCNPAEFSEEIIIDGEYWTVLPGTHAKHGLLKLQLLRVNS